MRAHIILPEELLKEVDRVAGRRRRSRFVEAAVREKLTRDTLYLALEKSAGILDPSDYPEWETPEETSTWVRANRDQDEARLERKTRGQVP